MDDVVTIPRWLLYLYLTFSFLATSWVCLCWYRSERLSRELSLGVLELWAKGKTLELDNRTLRATFEEYVKRNPEQCDKKQST